MAGQPKRAPRHPRIDSRSLIAWPGYQSGLKIDELDRRIVGAIAKPLSHTVHDYGSVSKALAAGMGVLLPAQAWRNQLPPDHPKRVGAFQLLDHHRPELVLDPDARALKADFSERYSADHLEAELGARATIATTPGHVLEQEGGIGRSNELLLARLTAEEFEARRAAVPAPSRPAHEIRELYATIVLQGQHALLPGVIDSLLASYGDMEGVSGYLIMAANCRQSGSQVAAYASLALRLQAITERPVVTFGLGDAHLALLASGVAATCAGVHGMSFQFPPAEFEELEEEREDEEDEDEDETGLGVFTYHRAILGNVGRLGPEGEPAREAIFKNHPCDCGHHQRERPPRKKGEIVRHNSYAVSADARAFTLADVLVAERKLLARAQNADRTRAFLKLSRLKRGFFSVSAEAAKLRGDQDAVEGKGS